MVTTITLNKVPYAVHVIAEPACPIEGGRPFSLDTLGDALQYAIRDVRARYPRNYPTPIELVADRLERYGYRLEPVDLFAVYHI